MYIAYAAPPVQLLELPSFAVAAAVLALEAVASAAAAEAVGKPA